MDFRSIYGIYEFSFMFSLPNQGGSGFVPADWEWLANVLLEAGETKPQLVIPQLAGLSIRTQTKRADLVPHEFDNERLEIFRKNLPRIMQLLAQKVEVKDFNPCEEKIIAFAREKARSWLIEHQSDRGITQAPKLKGSE